MTNIALIYKNMDWKRCNALCSSTTVSRCPKGTWAASDICAQSLPKYNLDTSYSEPFRKVSKMYITNAILETDNSAKKKARVEIFKDSGSWIRLISAKPIKLPSGPASCEKWERNKWDNRRYISKPIRNMFFPVEKVQYSNVYAERHGAQNRHTWSVSGIQKSTLRLRLVSRKPDPTQRR